MAASKKKPKTRKNAAKAFWQAEGQTAFRLFVGDEEIALADVFFNMAAIYGDKAGKDLEKMRQLVLPKSEMILSAVEKQCGVRANLKIEREKFGKGSLSRAELKKEALSHEAKIYLIHANNAAEAIRLLNEAYDGLEHVISEDEQGLSTEARIARMFCGSAIALLEKSEKEGEPHWSQGAVDSLVEAKLSLERASEDWPGAGRLRGEEVRAKSLIEMAVEHLEEVERKQKRNVPWDANLAELYEAHKLATQNELAKLLAANANVQGG